MLTKLEKRLIVILATATLATMVGVIGIYHSSIDIFTGAACLWSLSLSMFTVALFKYRRSERIIVKDNY